MRDFIRTIDVEHRLEVVEMHRLARTLFAEPQSLADTGRPAQTDLASIGKFAAILGGKFKISVQVRPEPRHSIDLGVQHMRQRADRLVVVEWPYPYRAGIVHRLRHDL